MSRAELDAPRHQAALHSLGEELQASVGLDALDRKRHFLQETVEKLSVLVALRRGYRPITFHREQSSMAVYW